jgi:hypothetical protein
MKYMVIETFKPGKIDEVYERYNQKGRMLSDGLRYIDSWLSIDRTKCFQLMEADRIELFDEWILNWSDLTDFEIIPVEDSPTKACQQNGAPEILKGADDF